MNKSDFISVRAVERVLRRAMFEDGITIKSEISNKMCEDIAESLNLDVIESALLKHVGDTATVFAPYPYAVTGELRIVGRHQSIVWIEGGLAKVTFANNTVVAVSKNENDVTIFLQKPEED